ncbi:MAG TPA: hypothetical protein VHY33_08575 [Thermoanaerobaculia bacterium]|jgi:hypothetical protein|nr:hypothetical protein [Thermoanaerobaculia bacterium]
MRTRIVTILVVLAAATAAHARVQQVRQYAAKFTRRYRLPREHYFAAWEELIAEYRPARSLEDVLGSDDDQPDA